tara:strand:+ start:306 stop:827 length:522 start_codon:yes stop_codon:yes gene_type:complete
MRAQVPITALLIVAGFFFSPSPTFAQSTSNASYKVLAREDGGFNVSTVERLIKRGDESAARGDLVKAKENYDKARNVSRQLLSFYRDLNGSFRGLDARVPREMDAKGRKALEALSKANLRLAALFRKQNQPEVAVPVLVEVVRLMTPASSQGKRAYEELLELGFAETPYASKR